jgi:hypothetical protein
VKLKNFSQLLLLSATLLSFAAPTIVTAEPGAPGVWYVNGQPVAELPDGPWQDVKQIKPDGALPGYRRFTDYPHGYAVSLPDGLKPNFSLSAIRSSFENESSQIEIYYDNFLRYNPNPWDYMTDANKSLLASPRHKITTQETFPLNGFTVNRLKWTRTPFAGVKGDRNYYASLELKLFADEYYTILIKSSQPIDNDLAILHSFRWIAKRGVAGIFRQPVPARAQLNQETRDFLKHYFSPDSPLRWGLFDGSAPDDLRHIKDLEARLGYKFPFILRYQSLDTELPSLPLKSAYANGRFLELSMETTHTEANNALQPGDNRINQELMYDILDGKFDEHFREYAKALKDFGHPVLFRFDNEMNGDWCWYSATYAGKDTNVYKAVWRRIHQLFDEVGVSNVLWVWNPNDRSFPNFKWNQALLYYPGDDVVDIIGLTGYNTGTYYPGETWRGFAEIYQPLYADYSAWFDKPFMIGEFGSNSIGGDKVAWVDTMFREIPQFNRIKVTIWWSGVDWDQAGRPARIYLLDENTATEAAFQRGLKKFPLQKQ